MWLNNMKECLKGRIGGKYVNNSNSGFTSTMNVSVNATSFINCFLVWDTDSPSTYTYSAANLEEAYNSTKTSISSSQSNSNLFVLIGGGTEAVSKDQYALSSPIFLDAQTTFKPIYKDDTDTISITTIYTNNSGSSVVVNEIGLGDVVNSSYLSSYASMLLLREVLDTPVTIAAGEAKSFTISIDLSTMLP